MSDQILNQCEKYLQNLQTFLKFTKDKNKALIHLFDRLKYIQNQTANDIKSALEDFESIVFQNHQESNVILTKYEELVNHLRKKQKYHLNQSLFLSQNFINPLVEFQSENYPKYSKLLLTLNDMLITTKSNQQALNSNQEEFFKMKKLVQIKEKSYQRHMDDFNQGNITQEDMQSEDQSLRELKIFTEQQNKSYQNSIQETNNSWNKLFQTFLPFVSTINKCENNKRSLFLSRIDFFINPLMTHQEIEKSQENYQGQNSLNLHTRISTQSNFQTNFQMTEKPEFKYISYEDYFTQKREDKQNELKIRGLQEDLNIDEKNKLNYMFQDIFSNLEMPEKITQKFNIEEFYQILKKEESHLQFLLIASDKLQKNNYFVQCHSSKIIIIKEILFIILQGVYSNEQIKIQKFDKILNILNRLFYVQNNKKQRLISEFQQSYIWRDQQLWLQYYNHLIEQHKNLQIKKSSQNKNIFGKLMKNVQQIVKTKNQKQEEQFEEQKIKQQYLKMIVFYLQNLKEGIPVELGKDIIIEIAKKNQIKKLFLVSQIDDYENDHILQQVQLRVKNKNFLNNLQKQGQKLGIIQATLNYLDNPKDYINISFLNKNFYSKLINKIYKKSLYSPLKNQQRIKVWGCVLNIVNQKNQKMLNWLLIKKLKNQFILMQLEVILQIKNFLDHNLKIFQKLQYQLQRQVQVIVKE